MDQGAAISNGLKVGDFVQLKEPAVIAFVVTHEFFTVGQIERTDLWGAFVRYLADGRVTYWHKSHLQIADAVTVLASLEPRNVPDVPEHMEVSREEG